MEILHYIRVIIHVKNCFLGLKPEFVCKHVPRVNMVMYHDQENNYQ